MDFHDPVAPATASTADLLSNRWRGRFARQTPVQTKGKDGDEFPSEYTKESLDRENVPKPSLPAVPPEKFDDISAPTAEPLAESDDQLARPNLLECRGLASDDRTVRLQPAAGDGVAFQTPRSAGQRLRGILGDRTHGVPQCGPNSRVALGG